MRCLFLFLLCIYSSLCFSLTKLTCYENGKLIYFGQGEDLYYDNEFFIMKEYKKKSVIITNSTCIGISDEN